METTQHNTGPKIILGTQKTESMAVVKVQAAEVIAEPFPEQRLLKWHPWPSAAASSAFSLVVTQDVLKAVCQHVAADLSREYGGFLFGNRYQCPQSGREYVLIDDYYKAEFTEGTSIQLVFTTDTWADLTDKRFTRFRGNVMLNVPNSTKVDSRLRLFVGQLPRLHYQPSASYSRPLLAAERGIG